MMIAVSSTIKINDQCLGQGRMLMPVSRRPFGVTQDGAPIDCYTLTNAHQLTADIMTYGGTLVALRAPNRSGTFDDVVLGFDTLDPYLDEHPYFGVTVGRYANRIRDGRFELNGVPYTLAVNNGPNHLHGGPDGFHRKVWNAQERAADDGPSVELNYLSRDGEENYPGNLSVTVIYTLTDQNELRIDYTATTDADTIINLTNHSYFNLAAGGSILDHELQLFASQFVPTDATNIPYGDLRPVKGTPMDFTTPTAIGAHIAVDDEQIRHGKGYDHTWVLDKAEGVLGQAARLYAPSTGRTMEVLTTEPGIQFYSGSMLDGSLVGKGGQRYEQYAGLCLEAHHLPDSPNQPQFPSTLLRPGEVYRQTTVYRFTSPS
jgi:aldose 1-epimerase